MAARESKTSWAAGGANSIESKRDSETDWRRTNQEKERRLTKSRKAEKSTEKQKVASQVRSAAQKAEESRRKIESGSIERLRVAESRQKKKAERRSKK